MVTGTLGLIVGSGPAGGVADLCGARTPLQVGRVSWKIRQASGLAAVPASPGVLNGAVVIAGGVKRLSAMKRGGLFGGS